MRQTHRCINHPDTSPAPRGLRRGLAAVLACALLAALVALPASASSHREAPLITELPKVDATDFYMFRSYEEGRGDYVTMIANYIPLQAAYGGPNYFSMDRDAEYVIHVDNDGDGVEDVSFMFLFDAFLRGIALPVGDEMVPIPLLQAGVLNTASNLNRQERFQVLRIDGELGGFNRSAGPAQGMAEAAASAAPNTAVWDRQGVVALPAHLATARPLTNQRTDGQVFGKPVDNIGSKTFPDYASYSNLFVHNATIPGCGDGRVFVGQRDDPFQISLGEVFDLINLNPVGDRDSQPDDLARANVTSIAIEVPASCLVGDGDVIGAWTTARLPRNQRLKTAPDFATPITGSGGWVQVSRLGMPLVNEVVIGLPDKNLFNSARPDGDAALATYVTNPTLPELIEVLFGSAGVQAPNNFPRLDLVAAFATGIQGLNFLSDGAPHEMLRLNTAIPPTPRAEQDNLGALVGDNAGFPNGRRPGDDVVDAELRVAMGALCHAFPGAFGCGPDDAPSGTLPYTDGVLVDASEFGDEFPYLNVPFSGSGD